MARPDDQKGRNKRWRLIWIGAGVLALLIAVASAWHWGPLAELIEPRKILAWAALLRAHPARTAIILGTFVIGSLVLVPVTVLIALNAIVFGPIEGSAYSMVGSLLGAAATYALGYFLGRDFVRQLTGPRWELVEDRISRSGVIAVATVRLLPVAPFTR